MKFEKGFKKPKERKSIFHYCPRIPSHAPCQVIITLLQIGTSVFSFIFVAILQDHVVRLNDSYEGEVKNEDHPCARRTLPTCNAETQDYCRIECCPPSYICIRDPTVGIYCQEETTTCGQFDFCLDMSDIPGTCAREPCQRRKSVNTMSGIVYVLAAAGVVLDLLDMIWCFALADNVVLKSVTNLVACLVKWLAFGGIMGVGTEGYLTDVVAAKCFNPAGVATVDQAFSVFQGGAAALFVSGLLSIFLTPISALHGGRLRDKPMYEFKVMDLGG